jgi:hypothetical protein
MAVVSYVPDIPAVKVAVGARHRPRPTFPNDLNEAKRLNDWNDWNWLRFRESL